MLCVMQGFQETLRFRVPASRASPHAFLPKTVGKMCSKGGCPYGFEGQGSITGVYVEKHRMNPKDPVNGDTLKQDYGPNDEARAQAL